MDKLTLLLGILIGVVVVLYFIPVWKMLRRSYEGFAVNQPEVYYIRNISTLDDEGGLISFTKNDIISALNTRYGASTGLANAEQLQAQPGNNLIPNDKLDDLRGWTAENVDYVQKLDVNTNTFTNVLQANGSPIRLLSSILLPGAYVYGVKPTGGSVTLTVGANNITFKVYPYNSQYYSYWEYVASRGSSSSSFSSSSSSAIASSSSSSVSDLRPPLTAPTAAAPTCPTQPNIEDAVSKAISDALGRIGGGGGSIRNKKTMNFGAAAGTSGLGMPMQSPPLDMQRLIEMAKALVDPSITVDSDSVRTKFTYKYGSANSLTPTQLADVYLIYLEYPNFYYNFYSILDQSNKDVFRKSYLSEQSQAISMINTFGMEVMIYLHQQLDPNFEADFGDQYEDEGDDDMGGTCKTDKALIEELKKCLTSSDVNCVQKVLDKYSETNITNTTNITNKPPPGGTPQPDDNTPPPNDNTPPPPPSNRIMGSSSSSYTPGPIVPVGSSSSYGLVIPPPGTTQTAGKQTGSAGKGTGGGTGGGTGEEECNDGDVEVIVNMPPAAAPVSSCPVCDGGGCNICSGTGSPSLGQGTNWKYITPQVSKCKTEEPIDMRWGY